MPLETCALGRRPSYPPPDLGLAAIWSCFKWNVLIDKYNIKYFLTEVPQCFHRLFLETCTCGRWGVRSDEGQDGFRIVGGTMAAPNSIPYQVKCLNCQRVAWRILNFYRFQAFGGLFLGALSETFSSTPFSPHWIWKIGNRISRTYDSRS